MAEPVPLRPRRDPWTAAIHGSEAGGEPLGAGVLIAERRVLTCAHVVKTHTPDAPVWVAFPKAGVARGVRRRVAEIHAVPDVDLAVLVLDGPAPPQARPAPLRCPEAADLVDERWWAFGFPAGAPYGSDAHGIVGVELAHGRVRLETESRYVVKKGFSGAGVWSPRFAAVVGLVEAAQPGGDRPGDALAVTLHQADLELPEEEDLAGLAVWTVAAAGEPALAAWVWTLDADPEAARHWRPRARGVAVEGEAGYRFQGRRAALPAVAG
jgi:hypothetical protein